MRAALFTAMFLSAVTLPLAAKTTSSTSDTISVCVGNLTGIIREVSTAKECLKALETFQQFNIQGPQGIQGPAGPMGVQGVAGPLGPAGVTGAKGATGAQGSVGPQGAVGTAGTPGVTGATGPQGLQGATGPVGPQGPVGTTGAAGPTGATGARGATGQSFKYRGSFDMQALYGTNDVVLYNGALYLNTSRSTEDATSTVSPDDPTSPFHLFLPQGASGATGATGSQGPQGLQGPQGPAGADGSIGSAGATGAGYYGTSTTTQTIAVDSLTFTTQAGLAYVANSRIRAIAPTASPTFVEGVVHDYQGTRLRIDVDTTSGSGTYSQWAFSLAGVQGIAGAAGPQGIAGPVGSQGAVGKAGLNGKDGRDGADGKPGAQGPTGPTGPAGPQYYVHFYTQTKNVPGTAENVIGGYDSESYNMTCPVNEAVVSGSCGYQAPESTSNQGEIHVNYAGVDNYRPNSAQCSVSNSNLSSNNIIIGISCLSTSPVPFGLVNSAAVKSCTYDPDMQAPCTAADAVPAIETGPGRFLAAPAAETAATASTTSTDSALSGSSQQGKTAGKSRKSVTLWFHQ